ncbi:MAG: nucleotidyltransferase family protein [Defluviitaleaceae bacterium]|nr:nucleotidyltransferase family protein [Defluviitaleaceae bacterium]
MSRICGIVAEYNPFHNGHKHHIAAARQVSDADHIIAVMSGNFVQRGEPAIVDKFTRTRMALLGGADLVLELPVGFATASAEGFASAAVYILGKTGLVTDLCFGAETHDLQSLQAITHILVDEPDDFKTTLRAGLAQGDSFPKARAGAVKQILPHGADIISRPNNILAIEYLKALAKFGFNITPHPVPRKGANHHDGGLDGQFASATALRREILAGNLEDLISFLPASSLDLLRGQPFNQIDNFSTIFHYNYNVKGSTLEKAAENHYPISQVVAAAKTKNITHTALKRKALSIVLDLATLLSKPQYIRILGFRRDKAHLIGQLEKTAGLPVITNLKNAPKDLRGLGLDKEIEATRLYWLALKPQNIHGKSELSAPMIII